jgi:S-(hydroxymethyl)glutathione dehydrogenase/alcohol dehydrogenase
MKAAVLNTIPGVLEIEDVSIDRPAANEVLIQTTNAGLCHSDLHFMEGNWQTRLPAVMGHEAAGVVEAVGEEVQYVKPGDRVITCLSIFCGTCKFCLGGRMSLCQNFSATGRAKDAPPRVTNRNGDALAQFARLGSFAEQMLVHQNAVVRVREEMPLDKAALIGCGVTTGMGAVFRTARLEPGSRVCVIGAGGVGLSAVQGARIAGAGQLIVVDLTKEKLDLATKLGASDVVNAAEVDPVEAVKELSGGGVDYAFEAIGLKKTVEQAWAMLAIGGTATVIGMMPFGATVEIPGYEIFMHEKKLQGSMMGSNQFRTDMPRFVDMYLDGRLMLDPMVSQHIPLEKVNDGYDAMRRGELARTVIDFD